MSAHDFSFEGHNDSTRAHQSSAPVNFNRTKESSSRAVRRTTSTHRLEDTRVPASCTIPRDGVRMAPKDMRTNTASEIRGMTRGCTRWSRRKRVAFPGLWSRSARGPRGTLSGAPCAAELRSGESGCQVCSAPPSQAPILLKLQQNSATTVTVTRLPAGGCHQHRTAEVLCGTERASSQSFIGLRAV